ncbi:MAG: hypothetical protein ACOC1U_08820, partial [Spirochaetota bacterium]
MNGLYQRALDYLQSQRRLRLVRPEDEDYGSFQGTPEEQQQIEGEIQRAVQENRLSVGPDTFRIRPQRRGAGLPIIVNITAVLLIAAGVYILLELFENQEQNLVTRTASVSSAEGRLLTALREESEQQLSAKEAQIEAIEQRLAAAETEREQIRANATTALAEQEAALRVEFEAELEAERQRLLGLDLSEAELEERLAAFRETRQSELEQSIAALEARAAEQIAEREEALAAVVDEFETSLRTAQQERAALEAELAEREAELESQFEQREAELSEDRAAAEALLQELRAQQESRQLVLDQILGYYTRIRAALEQGTLDDAAASLASLRTYLEEGPAAVLPELQRRRQVELFLVGTLEQQLARARGEQQMDMTSLVESAGLLAEVSELVARADASYASDDLARARELYVAALSQIPAVALGYERLQDIEATSRANESDQVTALLAAGNERYLAGDYAAAAQRYGEAIATLPLPDDGVVGRILDAGYQLQAADSLAELATLRDELAARSDALAQARAGIESRDATIESQAEELVTLRDRIQSVDELIVEQRER